MITEEMVARAYGAGVIRLGTASKLADGPDDGTGTVAVIGDQWFWFGGEEAEGLSPEEYAANAPEDDVVREMFEVLDGFREDARRDPSIADEYAYCEAVLSEHGTVDPSGTTSTSPA